MLTNVFEFRDDLIREYESFSRSFVSIKADDIGAEVNRQYEQGRYWPEPLIQINPHYQRKQTVQELASDGLLHPVCADIFKVGKFEGKPADLQLYAHQIEAIERAKAGHSYVVTTGTGSGKSLAFFIPMVDAILKAKERDPKPRTRAIVIYPMNALANSQLEELDKFLCDFKSGTPPFSVARYTGQESEPARKLVADNPPDILLTNFMMLELILTRQEEVDIKVVEHCEGLEFLVLDELHTYRGRQGADVAMLVRRLRQRLHAESLTCVGTSATMSSTGSESDKVETVAKVASKLFGTSISASDVIGETLERVTSPALGLPDILPLLRDRVVRGREEWKTHEDFKSDPLAVWVELTLGINMEGVTKPVRAMPLSLSVATKRLEADAGCSEAEAHEALQTFLMDALDARTEGGEAPFAFKLHQFVSGPGQVLCTLEPDGTRTITLDAQRFAPGRMHENVLLYPAHFCRECGQEYHPVWCHESKGEQTFLPREIYETAPQDPDAPVTFGFITAQSASQEYQGQMEQLPDFWVDLTGVEPKVKRSYKQAVPILANILPDGSTGGSHAYWYSAGKFRFCLNCGFVHEAHGRDANRLSGLSGEGRSSATTMLTLATLKQLFKDTEIPEGMPDPRKLLGFSDNRQDAALQAGHFNDFIFLLMLRSGLLAALRKAGGELQERDVADKVFSALGFDSRDPGVLAEYLRDPTLIGLPRKDAQQTLRFVLGYRLLRDLRKGWRFNNPNLDQLRLMHVTYRGLEECCAEEPAFSSAHAVIQTLAPNSRADLATFVLDEMRRSLCIDSRYLNQIEQERIQNDAYSRLCGRWSFGEDETLITSRYLITEPRPDRKRRNRTELVGGGPRSRLLRTLKRANLWKNTPYESEVLSWKEKDLAEIVKSLLKVLKPLGYVEPETVDKELVGWRVNANTLVWKLLADDESDTTSANTFFRHLYRAISSTLESQEHRLFDFEAQEHTAQVDTERRLLLESRFRYTQKDRDDWAQDETHSGPLRRLPVLFCSPTMELGVDISALNTVYMRNVPPTPANYAQRSGRAGRSGQPALVITYCAAMSPHDQWFFHNANEMVHGIVKAPTLDLVNRDLIDSHLQAVWLAATRCKLDPSIAPLLDLGQDSRPLKPELLATLVDPAVTERAIEEGRLVISQVAEELSSSDAVWFTPDYIENVMARASTSLDKAIDRWRNLHAATLMQMKQADAIARSHAVSESERHSAKRRYLDAVNQNSLLLKSGNSRNSDFYTFRYLASQGFLPGYNFPRLPLMAWIPPGGRGASGGGDEGNMVSRPRFLGLSEFGPRSLIYHQGRTFRVERAKLNVTSVDQVTTGGSLATVAACVCGACGYGHMGTESAPNPSENVCEHCGQRLEDDNLVQDLYRIETVETRAVERITVNDEERQRQGYDLQTTYRFLPGPDGIIQKIDANVVDGADTLATLTYSPAARLWRINRGWRRRKDKTKLGFYINPISGRWSKADSPEDDESKAEATEEAMAKKVSNQRIVPFVEDHRNILILFPEADLSAESMATLQAALKRGIEQAFQIESSELIAEPLPLPTERRSILFYEAAEGGAGVLSQLAETGEQLGLVARNALRLMHFDVPLEGTLEMDAVLDSERKLDDGNTICEAGCYQCLLSYYNQPDHEHIKRKDPDVLRLLVALANAAVERKTSSPESPCSIPGAASASLSAREQEWRDFIIASKRRHPDAYGVTIGEELAIATAQYKLARTMIFLAEPSTAVLNHLADRGVAHISFPDAPETWSAILDRHRDVFGGADA